MTKMNDLQRYIKTEVKNLEHDIQFGALCDQVKQRPGGRITMEGEPGFNRIFYY